MRAFFLAIAALATIALTTAVDNECVERRARGLPVHWSNPTDCSSFFRCTNKNIKRELMCPEGKEYNANTGRCGSKGKSLCHLSLRAPVMAATNPCANQISGIFVADSKSCRGFNICNNNLAYPQVCGAGSYFSTKTSACEPDTKSVCWENLCVKKPDGIYVEDSSDCHSFYICYEEKPLAQKCPDGSFFNAAALNCQPGKCPSDETSSTTTSTSETTDTTTITNEIKTTTYTAKSTMTSNTAETTASSGAVETTTITRETTTSNTEATTCTTVTKEPITVTTTCAHDTTTICSTTTSCAVATTTTSCASKETATPAAAENCSSLKCEDASKHQNAKDAFVFPAQNTNAGFCVCQEQRAQYYECPGNSIFDSDHLICVPKDQECASSKCLQQLDYTTFSAPNTTCGFCRCLNGKAIFLNCAEPGEVYNSELGVCVKSLNTVDCLSEKSSCQRVYSEGDFVPHPDNCMLFYICYKGELVESSCERGNYYDNQMKACLPDSLGKCPSHHETVTKRQTRSIKPSSCIEGVKLPASDCNKYYKCTEGHKILYVCERNKLFNVDTLSCEFDTQNNCWFASTCTTGEKMPDFSDKLKFYECVNGVKIAKSCPFNQHFNKLSMICKENEEHSCTGGYYEGDILPHLNACNKFYICSEGKMTLQDCGKNYYFDNSSLTCKRDTYNKCSAKKDCTCPGGYDKGTLSAHPKDCNKYYICEDGHQILGDCITNNYFNKNTLVCEPDINHECWPNLCATQPNGALVTNPQQCNAFFLCENKESISYDCLEGQYFDIAVSACVADLKAQCYNPCENETAGPVVLLPHPICNKYYFCNGRKTFVGTCQVGSFDIETGVCNPNKNCLPNPCQNASIQTFPDPYDPTKFYYCLDSMPIQSSCDAGKEYSVKYDACLKVSDSSCPICPKDGSYPTLDDVNDSEFCVCVDGIGTKIECPKDYKFNIETGDCYSNAPCDPYFCLENKEYAIAPNRNDTKSFCMCIEKIPTIVNCPNYDTFNPYTLECSNYEISPECLQFECINKPDTYVYKPINHKASNGFCQCVNQIATFRPCNNGSNFDPNLNICQLDEINCNSNECYGLADRTKIPALTTTEGYCECIAGIATYYNCPDNSAYDLQTNACKEPVCDLSKCTEGLIFPASNTSYGYCLCAEDIGFIPCGEDEMYSDNYKLCTAPCDQLLCTGKPDNYLIKSAINKNSFCICHINTALAPTYELCLPKTFVFDESQQMCMGNSKEFCGIELCSRQEIFAAKDTVDGFCLCPVSGVLPNFQACPADSIFIPRAGVCLPTAESVCNIKLCSTASVDHPLTLPANNSINQFCYCSGPNDVMLLTCPDDKHYSQLNGKCIKSEDNGVIVCPSGIESGQKVADTTSCNKYSICVNGVMQLKSCADGDYFNVNSNDCIPDVKGICAAQPTCTCLGAYYENERLKHPVNPHMYYVCENGLLHEYSCPVHLIYNEFQKQCVANDIDWHKLIKRSVNFDADHEVRTFSKISNFFKKFQW